MCKEMIDKRAMHLTILNADIDIVDFFHINQRNFLPDDVEFINEKDSIEHTFLVSLGLCIYFTIMFYIINYIKS
jgi:hypothetical protein|tara:strand:+ start:87 stop:308 length:222 start_codon:yes stop_codon:yes gene_type:complete